MNLEMRHISKTFSAVRALDDVHFSVSPSSIPGLLGENGAGKTTLMNILAGTFSPDRGSIIIDGKEITHMTPSKAMQLKIRFIHQELNLCNDLKVYENMFLGNELYTKIHTVDKKEEIARAEKVLKDMHADIPAQALVDDLETAEKQLVEIARALLFQSELIIMDEPTTALNNEEIENRESALYIFRIKCRNCLPFVTATPFCVTENIFKAVFFRILMKNKRRNCL